MQPMHRGEAVGMSLCAGFSGRLHGCWLSSGQVSRAGHDSTYSFRHISLALGVLARIPILGDLCKSEKANMFYLEAWVIWTISWFSELLKLEICGVVKVCLQLGGLLTNLPKSPCFEHLCFTRVECASSCCNTRWQCDALCSVPWFFLPLWDVQTLGEVYSLDCWTPRFSNLQLLPK